SSDLQKFPKGKYADQARYFLAEAQYQRGNKEQAVAAYREFIQQHPASTLRSSGIYALGVTLEELRQFPAAGALYDQFLKEFPKSDLATEVRLRKGETLLQTGAVKDAEQAFASVAAIADFPSADYALLRQAFATLKQDRFVDAAQLYAALTTRFPQSSYQSEATMAAGRSYYSAGKFDEATPWFQKVLSQTSPDTAEAAHWMCRIWLRKKDSKQVVNLAESVLSKGAEGAFRVHLEMDLGDALYELPEWRADSIDRYLAIVQQYPQHELAPQALYNAAFAAMEIRRFDDAIQHARTFVEKFPRDRLLPDAQFVAAESLLLAGQLPDAEAAYRKLLDQHGSHADANAWRIRLALACYMQKKYADVLAMLAPVLSQLKVQDQLAEAHYLMGASHYQRQNYTGAQQALAASLAAAPRWRQADEALLLLAAVRRATAQLPEARAAIAQLLKEFPQSGVRDQAYFRLGEYEAAAGNSAAALAAYDHVLRDFASSSFMPFAAYAKGSELLRTKDYAKAALVFGELLKQHPQHSVAPDASLARGMSLRQLGQFQQAIADFDAFLRSQPSQPRKSDALYERGLAEVGLEKYPAAAQTFAAILAENPQYPLTPHVLYELGWARRKANQPADALEAFARLAREHADSPLAPEALFHLGEDAYEKQDFPTAVKAYTTARQKGTGEIAEKATYKLGWSLFKAGDYVAAATTFGDQLKQFSAGALSGDARFMAAESLFKQGQYQEAYERFREAVQHPSSLVDMQVLTFLHGAQSASQLRQWNESLQLLDEIPSRFADTAYLAEALYERGWAKQNLQKLDEAVADYELAAARSRGEVGARARFMIGEIQFERRQHVDAVNSFLRVMYGFGGEKANPDVKNWQGTAGFEAGRCVELQLQTAQDPQQRAKLLEDARTYYRYVAERHPNHRLAAQARERTAELAKLK
ncbi:MAG: tol-pal system YbgF family protein, partial [Pirellulaceae bacterium]